MEDRTYTLLEARQVLREQACRQSRHQPATEIIAHGVETSRWYCDCGAFLYEASATRPR
jgi:hypothetical protein